MMMRAISGIFRGEEEGGSFMFEDVCCCVVQESAIIICRAYAVNGCFQQ